MFVVSFCLLKFNYKMGVNVYCVIFVVIIKIYGCSLEM